MKTILRTLFLFMLAVSINTAKAAEIVVTDDGNGTGTTTWTNDNTYILDGFVFVNDGQALTIEEGTVIKGMSGTGADASALVVARGGQLFANGTAENPIIFTFEADALDGSTPYDTRGQWGGVIILGEAQLNSAPGETQIEGIPETEIRGLYGGDNDTHSAGEIRYISIRHGGTDIGAGNEINGLTLGGVGSGTIIEHVEVVSNADDGIEFFGGTANVKYAIVAFCGDDSFDYDEGWRGKGQFWFTVHDNNGDGQGDRGGEHDGGTNPEDGAPYATPSIYNATYMGRGIDAGRRTLTFRDNAGGQYHNSIFYNWGRGIDIENLASGQDSYQRFVDGDLLLEGNCFWNVAVAGAGAQASDLFKISMGSGWASDADSTTALSESTDAFQASFAANGNEVADPQMSYAVNEGSEELIVKPGADVSASPANDPWFSSASYKGAFDPSEDCTWMHGWSFLSERGFIGCETAVDETNYVAQELLVYPNPNHGQFTVALQTTSASTIINIRDISGRIVSSTPINKLSEGSLVNFDLSAFGNGVYFIQFVENNTTRTARVIVR